MKSEIFGKFYNPTKALSYGRPWIFSTGSRSIGKSTGWMLYAIIHYLETGNGFLYVRRTDKEVARTAPSACNTAITILKNFNYEIDHIEYKRSYYYLFKSNLPEDKGEIIGRSIGLNLASNDKSVDYSHIDTIIYDEFMLIDSSKYLGNKEHPTMEYDKCLELYQTVDRGIGMAFRNVTKFIFIANIATYYNPIYIALGVDKYINPETKYLAPKNELWLVEQISEVEATKEADKSYAARLATKSQADYAYHGKALLDGNDTFVERITSPAQALCSLKYKNNIFGVYYIPSRQVIYISNKPTQHKPFALTVGDQDGIDYTIVTKPSMVNAIKQIQTGMLKGRVFFETKRVKMLVCTYMQLIPTLI